MSKLPLELYILIIDAVGSERRAGHWDDGCSGRGVSALEKCSLVCKAWYHHTIPRLWSSLVIDVQPPQQRSKDLRLAAGRAHWEHHEATFPLGEVLDIFLSNPRIMASVRHLLLIFSWTVKKHQLMSTRDLVDFCKALAPLPRFSWEAAESQDDTIFASSGEVADDDDHPLGQIVASFCRSPTLTTFHFSGVEFPLDVLKAMPNLRDISFDIVVECSLPCSSNDTSSLQSLPFRLRRARFMGAECVYAKLIEFEDIFSQLEELVVTSLEGGSWVDGKLARLVCLPKGTLRSLDIEITNTRDFAQGLVEQGQSLESLRTVEFYSIRIMDLDDFTASQDRAVLLDILEAVPGGLFSKLESFKLYLAIVVVPFFDTIFNPEHRAWRIATHLLGPNGAPALKSLSITTAWSKTGAYFVSYDDEMVNTSISSQCLEMLERCAPRWEDDTRNVERILKVDEPHYVPESLDLLDIPYV